MTNNPRRIHARRLPVIEALRVMPLLSHWPDKPEPYSLLRSHCVSWIVRLFPEHCPSMARWPFIDQMREAERILGAARRKGCVVFDPQTRLWRGSALSATGALLRSGQGSTSNERFIHRFQNGLVATLTFSVRCGNVDGMSCLWEPFPTREQIRELFAEYQLWRNQSLLAVAQKYGKRILIID